MYIYYRFVTRRRKNVNDGLFADCRRPYKIKEEYCCFFKPRKHEQRAIMEL